MKIKDESKKYIVEEYQRQVQESLNKLIVLEARPSNLMKAYIKGLEENIINAPYVLGYLEVSIEKEKKKK